MGSPEFVSACCLVEEIAPAADPGQKRLRIDH